MMDNFKKEAQKIRLSVDEKTRMRAQIFEQPVVVAPSTSPYFSFFTVSALLNVRSAVAAVLIFALVGSSTAYAAQGSLPGDLLYSVKIAVNERVELALATTPEKEIIVETRLAERRVAEAVELDAEGRLDLELTDEIEKNFDKHATRVLVLSEEEDEEIAITSLAEEAPALKMSETATDAQKVERKKDNVRASLESQKEVFKELKKRAELRSRGEVRGVSSELRADREAGSDETRFRR